MEIIKYRFTVASDYLLNRLSNQVNRLPASVFLKVKRTSLFERELIIEVTPEEGDSITKEDVFALGIFIGKIIGRDEKER